jgi:urease accessory protein UreE
MEKMACEELDDWTAFASVHLSRYLMAKHRKRFATAAERDMVIDLIRDHWLALGASGALAGKTSSRKLE